MFVCLFVYILSLFLSSFVYCYRPRLEFPDFFSSLAHPLAIYLESRESSFGREGEFFFGGCENRVCLATFPSRNKALKHPTRIRFPDLDLVLSRISLPLFFTHCRSSSKFSSIPLYRVTRPTYRVTKTYIVGKRLDFSQPPSTDWNTRKRPLGFYTRVRMPEHEYRVFHFQRSPRWLRVEGE